MKRLGAALEELASSGAGADANGGGRPICPSLPSSAAAYDLVQGKPGALVHVLATTLGRVFLIGVGMALLGERKNLARNALGGALGIEAFVLAFAAWKCRGADSSQ